MGVVFLGTHPLATCISSLFATKSVAMATGPVAQNPAQTARSLDLLPPNLYKDRGSTAQSKTALSSFGIGNWTESPTCDSVCWEWHPESRGETQWWHEPCATTQGKQATSDAEPLKHCGSPVMTRSNAGNERPRHAMPQRSRLHTDQSIEP
eukprot:5105218-Amphidinium_carterae.2